MKTNLCKCFMVFAVASFLFLSSGFSSVAEAAIMSPQEVKFWVLNDGQNDVEFNVITSLGVDFSIDGSSWAKFTDKIKINVDGKGLMSLRLNNDYNGYLTFMGAPELYQGINNTYSALYINWGDGITPIEFTVTSTSGARLAPVPIPPTVWILGAGLIGMIGIRRKSIS